MYSLCYILAYMQQNGYVSLENYKWRLRVSAVADKYNRTE